MPFDLLGVIQRSLIYILPAYFANGAPVLFGGGRPIDGGKLFWDGRPILGPRKTVRGFISGVVVGTITGLLLGLAGIGGPLPGAVFLGFLMGLGAVLGDLTGSFLKRRLNRPPGAPAPLLDQLDFVLGALLLSLPYRPPSLDVLACVLVLTPVIHLATNFGAYKLGLKKEPW
ncbi:hypothetical protein B6U66_01345 [Candidatus Bathyarchaeota archaeon ex4484_135]|nr:MAG: hypothetical protein B6U66_01345 [Candidatus Bathyarchaeota archaeon ex4484_135]